LSGALITIPVRLVGPLNNAPLVIATEETIMLLLEDVQALETDIKEKAREISTTLAYGQAEDYAQYQFMCGVVKGLNDTLELLVQAVKSEEEDNG
jgi:hypothetical protein